MPDTEPNFVDDNHALHAGMLIGTLMKAGVSAKPTIDDKGNYTPMVAIEVPIDEDLGTFVTVYVRVLASQE
jgi:hypothetical protein